MMAVLSFGFWVLSFSRFQMVLGFVGHLRLSLFKGLQLRSDSFEPGETQLKTQNSKLKTQNSKLPTAAGCTD
jgi:hypothetical protein